MLLPQSQLRIWLYTQPCDMRKSYNGLSALVKNQLQDDPLSGQLFVFLNRRRTQMKVLYFDGGGYCIWSKRLEAGYFHPGIITGDKQALSFSALQLMIDGIDQRSVRHFKRYSRPAGLTHPV